MRQKVISLIPTGASLFELSTPTGIWGPGRSRLASLDIDFAMCGLAGGEVQLEGGLSIGELDPLHLHAETADMIIIPTWPVSDPSWPVSDPSWPGSDTVPGELKAQLVAAHEAGTRIVGLCLGAFAVAEAGLLDGKTAVTHWRSRHLFEARFPAVTFEPNTLYVDHDTVVTSAGSAAAIDCCLHLVRRDHGAEAAASIARSMVTAPHRTGAQSQFASAPVLGAASDGLGQALAHAAEDITAIHSVGELAIHVGLSRRSLDRHLHERLGITPATWLHEQRVTLACRLLETSDMSVEEVAGAAGYGSTPTLRRALRDQRNTTPTAYRSMFGGRRSA